MGICFRPSDTMYSSSSLRYLVRIDDNLSGHHKNCPCSLFQNKTQMCAFTKNRCVPGHSKIGYFDDVCIANETVPGCQIPVKHKDLCYQSSWKSRLQTSVKSHFLKQDNDQREDKATILRTCEYTAWTPNTPSRLRHPDTCLEGSDESKIFSDYQQYLAMLW